MTRTVGSDGFANRGNTAASKLTPDAVVDIREEWSRKQELERIARENLEKAVALSSELGRLEAEAKEAMAAAMTITQRGLADQHGVSVRTIQAIVHGASWVHLE